ncbi:MAG: hypothetical protein OES26_22150 [Gammaproteobacteria bacterium]|nr:hypothetical protein [Gammaproteobacteria bacterium]
MQESQISDAEMVRRLQAVGKTLNGKGIGLQTTAMRLDLVAHQFESHPFGYLQRYV